MARIYTLDVRSDQGGLFPFESHYLEVQKGVKQAYIDLGPRDSPITFVLLHGNPTWSFLYRRYLGRLSQRYRTIAVDHVGFGRSHRPSDPAYYTIVQHIENLDKVLTHLEVKNAVLVVHDWGGPIGLGWADEYPERVAGFVIHNTWAFVKDPPMKLPWIFRKMVLGKAGWKRITQNNFFTEFFVRRGGTKRRLTRQEMDAYRAPHPAPEDRVGVARFPQLIPETDQPDHESWKVMEAIESGLHKHADRPALIVWAAKDPAFRKAYLERWQRVFKDVDGPHLLPSARHYLQEDASDDILDEIEAWAQKKFPVKRAVAKVRA